jgi:hypothetical protein
LNLCITNITISREFYHYEALEFLASHDRVSWDLIQSEQDLPARYKVNSWKLQSNEYFRYFKIQVRGAPHYKLAISGIEMYGYLF